MKKIKNNKYGFTLVELLAVIVILAIILVIAVPKVISIIEDVKKAFNYKDDSIISRKKQR